MTTASTFVGVFLALLLVNGASAQAQGQDVFLDGIVAVVGDDVITRRELVERVNLAEQQLAQRGARVPNRNVLVRQVMERMVVDRVQLQEARRVGISIDEITLNRTVENIAAENNLTLLQLRDALAAEKVDFATFRQ
jgi:peptidyl-prolyl cis-trans isomerase SurA